MSSPGKDATADEQQIAALREEIRRAGQRTRIGRLVLAYTPLGLGLAFAAWYVTLVLTVGLGTDVSRIAVVNSLLGALSGIVIWGPPLVLVGWGIALPVAASHRWISRLLLRRRLRAFSPLFVAEALAPLHNEGRGDTQRIIAPILRELRVHDEVAPVAASDNCGDEASPAEKTP